MAATEVETALEQPVYRDRVTDAGSVLGIEVKALAAILVDTLGADTVELLRDVTFQDITSNVSGAKPAKVRRVLKILQGDGTSSGKEREDGGNLQDLVAALKDEAKLWQFTQGKPLLCENGADHSAANIRHFQRTGQVPKVCVYAGCKTLLQHARGEVSFEDGSTFLAPSGENPNTGRYEAKHSLEERAICWSLIRDGKLTVDEAWRHLREGTLREHFTVDIADLRERTPNFAQNLLRSFYGVRSGGGSDPFYRVVSARAR